MDTGGVVRSLVMSCRVFQRRLEYAFLAWLADQECVPSALEFVSTPRNEPMRMFLDDPAFHQHVESGTITVDWAEFRRSHADDLAMFTVVAPQFASARSAD